MTRTVSRVFVLFACLLTLYSAPARAQDEDLLYSVSFTAQELDTMLAPIALYPDPLLAQILPASTYPSEVAEADAWLKSGGNAAAIDDQPWAESVKAVAHYPDVLAMMAGNMDWTANVGDAFVNQPEEVTDSIQRLRWEAQSAGSLVSNAEQNVVVEDDSIEIVPAQPQYLYVPQYDASAVYLPPPPDGMPPVISFGFGLVIGGWLTMDFDWGRHHVIYHGWHRHGWVDHARPYVHVRNVYINNNRPFVNQVWRHDRSHGDPARYLASHPSGPNARRYARIGEARGSAAPAGPAGGLYRGGDARAYSNRGRESRGIVNRLPAPPSPPASLRPPVPVPGLAGRPAVPVPPVVRREPPPAPPQAGSSVSRPQQQRPATPSGTFGGYRGAGEARSQSMRGQESRQSSGPARPPSPPPASRERPHTDRDSGGDRRHR
ncbi:MAG TPA: DUF3300 domain-containing protein [Nitrospirota bacterium]|nr:DUF3300 domain-containing protein [Nitrospirota bacterium]